MRSETQARTWEKRTVAKQEGNECGVYVMANAIAFMNMEEYPSRVNRLEKRLEFLDLIHTRYWQNRRDIW